MERLAVRDEHLVHVGQLPHLERLYLARTQITDHGMGHLAGLTRLRRLSLWGTKLTDAGIEHLAAMRHLEALDIHETVCTQACLAHLAPAKRMKALRLGFALDDRGLADLARLAEQGDPWLRCRKVTLTGLKELRRLRGVTTLSLEETTLREEEAQALTGVAGLAALDARSGRIDRPAVAVLRRCPSLKRLCLCEMGIPVADVLAEYASLIWFATIHTGAVDLRAPGDSLQVVVGGQDPPFDLSELSNAAELRSLHFNESEYLGSPVDFGRLTKLHELVWIPPLDDPQLWRVGTLANLKTLILRLGPGLSPAALEPLGGLRDLESLSLYRCHLTDEHLSFLQHLTSLKKLELGENPLKGDFLSRCKDLPQLEELSLLECEGLEEVNLKHVAAIKSLRQLTLQYTPVSDEGLKALYGMPNLRGVALLRSRVSPQAKAALKATLPAGANVF